jgi:hypothetical protein
MLKPLRQTIINRLWETYRDSTPQMQLIEKSLQAKGQQTLILDHFAIIDLPGPHSGIPQLSELFSALGYIKQGQDYLPDKQNDFLWMAESSSAGIPAKNVLPQVVVADFRPEEMPPAIRKIIEHYARQSQTISTTHIQQLAKQAELGCKSSAQQIHDILLPYLKGRDWPLPTMNEFYTVHEFNELLAWVLVFGRKPNHFTLSVHLLDGFDSLTAFHEFIERDLKLPLNHDGGVIKGGKASGIEQGSTEGMLQTVKLADGNIELPTGFVEFVWRYPHRESASNPIALWDDFFTGFVAQHANRVIQSLYL